MLGDTPDRPSTAGMDEQDIIDLLELQRLTRELLDHLVEMFPPEDVVDLLRAMEMVSKLERETDAYRDLRRSEDATGPFDSCIVDRASRVELTLLPTCLPRQGGAPRGDAAGSSNEAGDRHEQSKTYCSWRLGSGCGCFAQPKERQVRREDHSRRPA